MLYMIVIVFIHVYNEIHSNILANIDCFRMA